MKIDQVLGSTPTEIGGQTMSKTMFLSGGKVYFTFAKVKVGDEREEESRREFKKQDGTIETTIRFKSMGGFGGAGMRNDPNTRKEIIRQNSLTNAVNYVIAKTNLMDKKEALKYMSGKAVVQVATYFAKYSEGVVTVVTESEKEKSDEEPPTIKDESEENPDEPEVDLDKADEEIN
jgi:hypothetical protein